MAPKFDKSTGRWFTDVPEEMEGSSYGPVGSLYRAGPKPFFSRIFNADTYDQAVLKYMAQDGCDRKEAQGNMDAFREWGEFRCCSLQSNIIDLVISSFLATVDNPQDWGYQKVSEQNGAYKKDYANANMQPKQVILSTIWGLGVVYFIGNLIYSGINDGMLGDSFHRTMELLGVKA